MVGRYLTCLPYRLYDTVVEISGRDARQGNHLLPLFHFDSRLRLLLCLFPLSVL